MLACWSCCRGDVNFAILETGEVIKCGHVQKQEAGSPWARSGRCSTTLEQAIDSSHECDVFSYVSVTPARLRCKVIRASPR